MLQTCNSIICLLFFGTNLLFLFLQTTGVELGKQECSFTELEGKGFSDLAASALDYLLTCGPQKEVKIY